MKHRGHSPTQRLLALFMALAIALLPQLGFSASRVDFCEVPSSSSPILEEEIPHACAICFSPALPKTGVSLIAAGTTHGTTDTRCLHHGEVAVPPPRTR